MTATEFATVNVCAVQPPADSAAQQQPGADQSAHEEHQYLELVRCILQRGKVRNDRTGTGTLSLFAPPQLRFDLGVEAGAVEGFSFPLLTTKRVFFRGVAEELLWFLRGDTDATHLAARNVHIWDGNGSREYLDSVGLTGRRVGDLGPVYGFQWRHFGARYTDCDADYTGHGVDQLADLIDAIQTRPHDRRLILSAWNPADLQKMALPPCHMFCQFYVDDSEEVSTLSCQLYQRSCDVGLGVPFNIASYALLTRMLAHVCNMRPGTFIHCMGDAHVYANHVDAMRVQVGREPRPFPRLRIRTQPGGGLRALLAMSVEDFEIVGYAPHGKLPMAMAV